MLLLALSPFPRGCLSFSSPAWAPDVVAKAFQEGAGESCNHICTTLLPPPHTFLVTVAVGQPSLEETGNDEIVRSQFLIPVVTWVRLMS